MKPADPIPNPANHPRTCRTCQGTGQEPGPPIYSHANGDPVTYTTVQPCTDLSWYNQNRGWDPYHDELLDADHPRARAAFLAGYLAGAAELEDLRRPHPPDQLNLDEAG